MSSITRFTVYVGLSGGVDSSVSVALLKKAGYDVTGVFIRVWQPDFFECQWKDDRLDAMRVCAALGIPFRELDLEREYKKEVVDYMIAEYQAGKTPNPDVMCNRFIKFGAFYEWAMKQGGDFVATGHYARIMKDGTRNMEHRKKTPRSSSYILHASSDPKKDQSYFLWQLRTEQLSRILFPVGGFKKTEVRKLAKKFGLITADKKDSQGLCFIGKVDMKEFLSHYITPKPGDIVDERGRKLGRHEGAFFYTLGERASVGGKKGVEGRWYISGKDMKKNTLTVSQKNSENILEGSVTEVFLKQCNWLTKPENNAAYSARVRYRQPLQQCRFRIPAYAEASADRHDSQFKIIFKTPQTVAPGQSLVVYDGDMLIGGGIIDKLGQ